MFESLANLPSPSLPRLQPRAADSHKGDYGQGLLIGGSRGMSGAISLSGLAALRSGAGLVRLAVPDRCLDTVASFSPCFMTVPLDDDERGQLGSGCVEQLESYLSHATCVAIGPGLGRSSALQSIVMHLVRTVACPLVIDADGLNNLAEVTGWADQRTGPLVLTPHPGEWSRLSGQPAGEREAQCQAAVEFARRTGSVVVLKGTRTLVTDGETAVWNATGTPAMATGGSGDVLTGLLTALICQGLSARDAAHLAVHLHGAAAELAEQALETHVVLPTELIDFLPAAMHSLHPTS